MKNSMKFIAILAIAASGYPAIAQETAKEGFYVAPGVEFVILPDFCGSTVEIAETSCEDSAPGFGLTGGYRLNELFAVEGGFRFATGFEGEGTFNVGVPDDPIDAGDTIKGTSDFKSWTLGLRGFFPVFEQFSATGSAGFYFWDLENFAAISDSSGVHSVANIDTDGTDFYVGIGGEFATADNINVRASYTRYFGDGEADIISANVVWQF